MSNEEKIYELYEEAVSHFKNNKPDLSIKILEKALKINPKHVEILITLGYVYYQTRDNTKAREFYDKALKADPKSAKALSFIGDLYKNREKDQIKALKFYDKAIKTDPNFIDAHRQIASIKMKEGKWEEAMEDLQKVIDLDPGDFAAKSDYMGASLEMMREGLFGDE